MKWWLSDFCFELALLFGVAGWVAASVGPVPTVIAWGLAAVGFGIAPTQRRAITLLGIVLILFYYIGLLILLAAFANYITVSLQRRQRTRS